MFMNRLTLGYVFLVGAPVLLLVGTLRVGESLTAPPAIAGDWVLAPVDAGRSIPPAMTIRQQGSSLLVSVRGKENTEFAATLENGHFAGAAGTARLEALVAGHPGHRWIEGQLSSGDCPSCTPVRFRAAKSTTPEGKTK